MNTNQQTTNTLASALAQPTPALAIPAPPAMTNEQLSKIFAQMVTT